MGGKKRNGKKMSSHCGQQGLFFQSELTQQKEEKGGEGEGKKSQDKSTLSCLPSFQFGWFGPWPASQRLVSKGGDTGGKGIWLLEFFHDLAQPRHKFGQ